MGGVNLDEGLRRCKGYIRFGWVQVWVMRTEHALLCTMGCCDDVEEQQLVYLFQWIQFNVFMCQECVSSVGAFAYL